MQMGSGCSQIFQNADGFRLQPDFPECRWAYVVGRFCRVQAGSAECRLVQAAD